MDEILTLIAAHPYALLAAAGVVLLGVALIGVVRSSRRRW